MHEMSLLKSLMSRIDQLAREAGSTKVTRARIKLGALAHISPDHLREHFEEAAVGTVAEGATLDITVGEKNDPLAGEIVLDSIDVEET